MAIRQLVLRGKGLYCSVRCAKFDRPHMMTVSKGRGYRGVLVNGKYKFEHILVAEKALGKPLPKGAVVHHVDENPSNNSNENLVICENNSYHKHLHKLARIVSRGGDPQHERLCYKCDKVKNKSEFYVVPSRYDGLGQYCKPCERREKYEVARIDKRNPRVEIEIEEL